MKRMFSKFWDNILFFETLLLLIFIPLFPKLPILDVRNTWVYIRSEDFIVFFAVLSWIALLVKKKISFKTPLTIPILAFWIIGAVATLHGVLLVFPTLANVFPNVAFLSLLRHIEYLSLFFIAYHGMKDKRMLPYVISVLAIAFTGVVLYGFGQRYLGFPAYLTMNEEFAKGIPITLSHLSRVPSTFGGHYDLAAYLVLMIPIFVSLVFGFRNLFIKIFFLTLSFAGFILLFMTVSRVSFFVLFAALFVVFFFQKRKIILLAIPLVILLGVFSILFQSSLLDRFKSTVAEVNVVVDAQTGEPLGHVKFVSKEYLKDKIVLQRRIKDKVELASAVAGEDQEQYYSTSSAILPYRFIPPEVPLVTAINISTGENLPQGTSYTNLYLSPVVKRLGNFYYELPPDYKASLSAQILVFHGDFIVKGASAYDLSFTTRFQGEWPKAIEAFTRNILVGSGYGSVSLAVDNNYLRILGEIGLLGFVSFFVIFLSLAIYIKKIYPDIDDPLTKSFILGFGAGVIGLALNATLIDVFEASKIAFFLWTLSGIVIATLVMYQKRYFNLLNEIKKVATSSYAIILYLFLLSYVLFSPAINAYFVGDDFTWLRWVADCADNCSPTQRIASYLFHSDGFFYRPGTKLYFYLMYEGFWLNQVVYHLVSILLHFAVTALFFILTSKILKNKPLAVLSAFLFLILSGSTEAIFWISSVGYLFTSLFALLSLLLFILWDEKRKAYYYIASLLSLCFALLFHELGVVVPLLIIAYQLKDGSIEKVKSSIKRWDYLLLFIPVIGYLAMRFVASSHWFSGDYNYNLIKLPFNLIGNLIGYASLTIAGPVALPFYGAIRDLLRDNLLLALSLTPLLGIILFFIYKLSKNAFTLSEKRIIIFGFAFFVISLLPFLGLGNITSRYSYLASLGLILVGAILVKKLYEYLESNGRETAFGAIAVIVSVFALFQVIQVQQTYFEWREAGAKARRFFISLEAQYSNEWSREDVSFHFVDVPIRVGNAWVFPVGISDAVWFAFRNDKAKIYLQSNLKTAIEQAGYSESDIVLKFNEDGSVRVIDRTKYLRSNLITPQE